MRYLEGITVSLLAAGLLAACGSSGSAESSATTTTTVSPDQATAPEAVKTAASPSSAPKSDPKALKWLQENYSDRPWVDGVTGVRPVMGGLWAETKFAAGSSTAATFGQEICSALSGYEIQELGGFTSVSVRAADGQRISLRASLGDDCLP